MHLALPTVVFSHLSVKKVAKTYCRDSFGGNKGMYCKYNRRRSKSYAKPQLSEKHVFAFSRSKKYKKVYKLLHVSDR